MPERLTQPKPETTTGHREEKIPQHQAEGREKVADLCCELGITRRGAPAPRALLLGSPRPARHIISWPRIRNRYNRYSFSVRPELVPKGGPEKLSNERSANALLEAIRKFEVTKRRSYRPNRPHQTVFSTLFVLVSGRSRMSCRGRDFESSHHAGRSLRMVSAGTSDSQIRSKDSPRLFARARASEGSSDVPR